MLFHPHRQRDRTPEDQPGIERADTGTQMDDAVFSDVGQYFLGTDYRSAKRIPVTVDISRSRCLFADGRGDCSDGRLNTDVVPAAEKISQKKGF
jgi:hypothetical protein